MRPSSRAPLLVLAGFAALAIAASSCGRAGPADFPAEVTEEEGDAPTPTATGTPAAASCSSCHPFHDSGGGDIDSMSGQHGRHLRDLGGDDATCFECHGSVVDEADAISAPALHQNGAVELDFPGTDVSWNASSGRCDGTCHGSPHTNEPWVPVDDD